MSSILPTFLSPYWTFIWPLLALAVLWILIRFVFRLAMRVMLTGCAVLLVVGAVILVLRLVH